jgi:hypothetical protein
LPDNNEARRAAAALVEEKVGKYLTGADGVIDFWTKKSTDYLTMMSGMLAEGDKASWISNQMAFAINTYKEVVDACLAIRGEPASGSSERPVNGVDGVVEFTVDQTRNLVGPTVMGGIYAREFDRIVFPDLRSDNGARIAAEFIEKGILGELATVAVQIGAARRAQGGTLPGGTYAGKVTVTDESGASVERAMLTVHVDSSV